MYASIRARLVGVQIWQFVSRSHTLPRIIPLSIARTFFFSLLRARAFSVSLFLVLSFSLSFFLSLSLSFSLSFSLYLSLSQARAVFLSSSVSLSLTLSLCLSLSFTPLLSISLSLSPSLPPSSTHTLSLTRLCGAVCKHGSTSERASCGGRPQARTSPPWEGVGAIGAFGSIHKL